MCFSLVGSKEEHVFPLFKEVFSPLAFKGIFHFFFVLLPKNIVIRTAKR